MLTPDEIRALREYTEMTPGTDGPVISGTSSRRDRMGKRYPQSLMQTRWPSSNVSRNPEQRRCVLSLTEASINGRESTLAELLQFLRRLLSFRTVGVFFLDLLEEKPGVTCIL